MAINKSKVAVGFIVLGVLAVFFGTALVFVGPIIIDDQIVKVGRHTFIVLNLSFVLFTAFICSPIFNWRVTKTGMSCGLFFM